MKFGLDSRADYLDVDPQQHFLEYLSFALQGLITNSTADLFIPATAVPSELLSRSLSFYGQDTWNIDAALSLCYGLRWEVVPAPSARSKTLLAAWENLNDAAEIQLAPAGTSVWATTYDNLAPRIGVAYALDHSGDFVLRAGTGIFYDLGIGTGL